jgi:hypothetical protein
MWLTKKTRSWIAGLALCALAEASALAQARQYLDAGKGESPFDVTVHGVPRRHPK